MNNNGFPSETATGHPSETAVPASPTGGVEKRLTSRYRGVCWNRKNRRWQTAINRGGKYIYLGSFVSEIDAAKAFDRAAVKLRGHSTKINFDFEDYRAELLWHEETQRVEGAAEAILADPKILRENTDSTLYSRTSTLPQRIQDAPPLNNNGLPQLLPQQEQHRLTMPVPILNYIQNPVPSPTPPFNNQPGFLPHMVPSSTDLSANLLPPRPMLPHVVQDPSRRLFHGTGNAFAVAYSKANTPGVSVLVFDGNVMNENGVFSTMEDAAQACKSLLKIMEKVQIPQVQAPTTMAPPKPQTLPNDVTTDALEKPSPFLIEAGRVPEFLKETNGHTFFAHDKETKSQSEDVRTSYPGDGATSIQKEMGSLLKHSNQHFENLEKAPAEKEKTSDANLKIPSINMPFGSKSIEELISVLNPNGQIPSLNSGSIKREREDDDHSFLSPPSIGLYLEEKSFTFNTHPMIYGFQNEMEDARQGGYKLQQGMQDGNGVMKKRKSEEMQNHEMLKKAREAII